MRDLMIDLETAGKGPTAVILSIGAVFFDLESGELGQTFYEKIDPVDSFKFGRADGDTFRWWMKQEDDARRAATSGTQSLAEALQKLAKFFMSGKFGKKACVWGNGPHFDITILDAAYRNCLRQDSPWESWNVQDCRTAGRFASGIVRFKLKDSSKAHDALYDAMYQAEKVIAEYKACRSGVPAQSARSSVSPPNAGLDTVAATLPTEAAEVQDAEEDFL